MIARTHTLAMVGLSAYPVEVEADVNAHGLPHFQIVRLPDAAVSESRERVRSALRCSGLEFPSGRITVNLAPADLRKEGPCFDLPIALAIAAANNKIDADRAKNMVSVGELSLDGRVRGVQGIFPAAIHHHQSGCASALYLPASNAAEAAHVGGLRFVAVHTLQQAAAIVDGTEEPVAAPPLHDQDDGSSAPHDLDFAEVRGQSFACRALQIVAAGGHNALLVGPPGSGKSMLAQRLPTILPRLTDAEALEVTQIYSVAGLLNQRSIVRTPPFRAPHHSCSAAGLIGGGSCPRPGEISLAHCGVLFLDEALEFPRSVLETLRQPLESGTIALSRAQVCVSYPARIMLVLALNPCPCGYCGDSEKQCICTPLRVDRYRSRLSGPLQDRIDLHHEVARRSLQKRDDLLPAPPSQKMAEQVAEARARQARRGGSLNGRMPPRELALHCRLSDSTRTLLRATADALGWSQRTHQRVLRVARTIADLEACEDIGDDHVAEAIAHRRATADAHGGGVPPPQRVGAKSR